MTRLAALRLPASELPHLRLSHLSSGIDGPAQEFALPESAPGEAAFTGYTEWLGATDPGVSLGWDWMLTAGSGLLTAVPGTLRTNLVLTDATGADLPQETALSYLADYLARWPWQATVLEILKAPPPQAKDRD